MENDAAIGWIAAIIIGGIAGWLAEQFMKSNMGMLMNIVLGIVGAIVANAILSVFGIVLGGWIGYLIAGFIGACILIAIARMFRPGPTVVGRAYAQGNAAARRLRRQNMTDTTAEFPADWFTSAKLSPGKRDPSLNCFRINASQPLSVWRAKGWIYPDDQRGWFQWYCRYYLGADTWRGRAPDKALEGHASSHRTNSRPVCGRQPQLPA